MVEGEFHLNGIFLGNCVVHGLGSCPYHLPFRVFVKRSLSALLRGACSFWILFWVSLIKSLKQTLSFLFKWKLVSLQLFLFYAVQIMLYIWSKVWRWSDLTHRLYPKWMVKFLFSVHIWSSNICLITSNNGVSTIYSVTVTKKWKRG